MMRARFASLFVLLVAAPLLFGQASTTITNQRVEFDFLITDCSGQPVVFLGEAHVVQQSTGNANGGHSFVHINFSLQGESASGTTYIAYEQLNGIEVQAGATAFQNSGHLNAISQGPEDNLHVHTTIHFTVNANGEVTAESFEFETDCNG
jgi:hypothetical protein